MNSQQLQRAVALSGLFHEARLLNGQPSQPGDIKTRLLQLLATVVLFRCFMLCSEPAVDLDERS